MIEQIIDKYHDVNIEFKKLGYTQLTSFLFPTIFFASSTHNSVEKKHKLTRLNLHI